MADVDLSRIVGLIMENPSLVEEIKALANGSEKEEEGKTETAKETETEKETVSTSMQIADRRQPSRRRELLSALKPYLSESRCKAVDQMLSITDILEMMRTK